MIGLGSDNNLLAICDDYLYFPSGYQRNTAYICAGANQTLGAEEITRRIEDNIGKT